MAGMLLCFIPILIVPFFAGISILNNQRKTPLRIMAGILTLKPIVLTPILVMLDSTFYSLNPGLAMSPAIIVTAVIVFAFRSLFFGYEARRAAWLLLALDTLRWLSTLGLSSVDFLSDPVWLFWLFGIPSIAMPTVFAVVALIIADQEAECPQRKRKTADI